MSRLPPSVDIIARSDSTPRILQVGGSGSISVPFVRVPELRILVSAMLLQMALSTQEIMIDQGRSLGKWSVHKGNFSRSPSHDVGNLDAIRSPRALI
jgi:hypothetical protein